MKSKINMKIIVIIIVCLVITFLSKNFVFSSYHNIIVQHYDRKKNEYMFYKNITTETDIQHIHSVIHDADWEKYIPEETDTVLCQFFFDNKNDKMILYQIVNADGEFLLIQKDTDKKSSLDDTDLELMKKLLP